MSNFLAFTGWLGDGLLVAAGMVTIIRAFCGLSLERKARKQADIGRRAVMEADARTFYALNTLQQPWMLGLLAAGFACKALVIVWQAAVWLRGL